MFLFYLITLFYGSNSLPLSLLSMPSVNKTKSNDDDLLAKIKSNPQKFVSEFQNLDPADLKHIISLLEELREKSVARENELVTDLNNKNSALADANSNVITAGDALDVANQAVTDAETDLAQKNDAVTEQQGILNGKQADAAAAEADLTTKKAIHKTKQTERNVAQTAHDDEVPDLNDEQQILTDVVNMLQGLHDKHTETSPTEGEIRLSNYPQGRLQVFKENDWHTVCGHFFWDNHNGGQTACKQLGYPLGGIVHRTAGGPITENEPIYVGTCLAGEIPGQCSGNCCSQNCERNAINCGACAIGTNAAFELQCFGDREGSGGTGAPCTDRDDFAVGDGTGGSERYLGDVDTLQECLDLILAAGDANANGMTVQPSLTDENPTRGKCFVELGINAHDGRTNWRTCAFGFDINA